MIDASEFPHLLVGRLKNNGFATALSIEFAAALRRARPYSIDAFLEMRREFREVGKAAIANALLRAELNSEIAKVKPAVDWYRYLFNRSFLLKSQDHFRAQVRNLTVVTFNFDRSFEWALFSSVKAALGLAAQAARTLVTELEIHHYTECWENLSGYWMLQPTALA